MNIGEGLKTLGEFKRLSEIVSKDGGEQRWTLLQEWLADHPKYRKRLYHCLSLTPKEAMPYLCGQLGLDFDGLRMFDPGGQMQTMAERTIEQLQALYKERSAADAAALLTETPKPRKKRTVNR